MIQLALPLPPPPLWPTLGRWMLGDAPEPVELRIARDARVEAERHRREVRASWGGR